MPNSLSKVITKINVTIRKNKLLRTCKSGVSLISNAKLAARYKDD
jgi:hypothetical protein